MSIGLYHRYRREFLGMISDEQIMHAICDGGKPEVLRRFYGVPLDLRRHISQRLGQIEREHNVWIPEWCAPAQTMLVETFACSIETALFGKPQMIPGCLRKTEQAGAKKGSIIT